MKRAFLLWNIACHLYSTISYISFDYVIYVTKLVQTCLCYQQNFDGNLLLHVVKMYVWEFMLAFVWYKKPSYYLKNRDCVLVFTICNILWQKWLGEYLYIYISFSVSYGWVFKNIWRLFINFIFKIKFNKISNWCNFALIS